MPGCLGLSVFACTQSTDYNSSAVVASEIILDIVQQNNNTCTDNLCLPMSGVFGLHLVCLSKVPVPGGAAS